MCLHLNVGNRAVGQADAFGIATSTGFHGPNMSAHVLFAHQQRTVRSRLSSGHLAQCELALC